MLEICLVFWESEPQYAYKRYAYKKNLYTQSMHFQKSGFPDFGLSSQARQDMLNLFLITCFLIEFDFW